MRLTSLAGIVALAALAAGCTTPAPRRVGSVTVGPTPVSSIWMGVADAADQDRIGRLALAWQEGLAEAKGKHGGEVADEGLLLKPGAALPYPAPTPGSYNCRMDSLGFSDHKLPAFEKFKPFFCYVEVDDQGQLTIVKQTGSQRPAGRLWYDDNPNRMIFLGSLALADEKEPLAYGSDPDRDMAGVFERIAPFRWRLVIPWPRNGAKLQVFELVPVPDQPK